MHEHIYKLGDRVRAKFQINVIPKGSVGAVVECGCDATMECVQFPEMLMHFSPRTIGWVERTAETVTVNRSFVGAAVVDMPGDLSGQWFTVQRSPKAAEPSADSLAISQQLARALEENGQLRAARSTLEAERNALLARNAKLADVAATRDEIDAHRARLMDECIRFRRELERCAPKFLETHDRNRGKK